MKRVMAKMYRCAAKGCTAYLVAYPWDTKPEKYCGKCRARAKVRRYPVSAP